MVYNWEQHKDDQYVNTDLTYNLKKKKLKKYNN